MFGTLGQPKTCEPLNNRKATSKLEGPLVFCLRITVDGVRLVMQFNTSFAAGRSPGGLSIQGIPTTWIVQEEKRSPPKKNSRQKAVPHLGPGT